MDGDLHVKVSTRRWIKETSNDVHEPMNNMDYLKVPLSIMNIKVSEYNRLMGRVFLVKLISNSEY
jgi:hypothetical protein